MSIKKLISIMLVLTISISICLMYGVYVGAVSSELAISSVTASSDDGNVPTNTIDNNFSTRWSASGDQWIKYDLGLGKSVDYVEIAFLNGDTRLYSIDIQISNDNANFTSVFSGQSSGTTTGLQVFNFTDSNARYVRIYGHGNNINAWNSLTEVNIFGAAINPTVNIAIGSVTASADDGNVPANTIDNDFSTRWSASGDQWIKYDLGLGKSVDYVEIAFLNGDTRLYSIDIQISNDNSNFTSVFSGQSSGTTTGLQKFDFTDSNARYVRIYGHGNNINAWNSLTEVNIFGYDSDNVKRVSTVDQLNTEISNASAGTVIELLDGNYNGTINTISSKHDITIRAKNTDMAVLAGPAYFNFENCSYITLQGIKITSNVTLGVQLNGCNNMHVTRCHFILDEPSGIESIYLKITGSNSHHNRVDKCTFEDKNELGKMIAIHGAGDQMSMYDTIDNNYFKNNTPYLSNGKETIQAGLSSYSLKSAYTIFENNLFENCSGEPEIISLKACDITVRYNTFRNCIGSVTARHGDRDQIYGNFFFGDGVTAGMSGIRIYDSDHKVYNNFFKGLTGTAIIVDGGDADGSGALTDHWRVYRAEIAFNTIIDCSAGIELGPKYVYSPVDCKIANNIVKSSIGRLFNDVKSQNTLWQGNIGWAYGSATIGISKSVSEIRTTDPLLSAAGEIFRLQDTSPAKNAAIGTYTYITDDLDGQTRDSLKDVGADEYPTSTVIHSPLTTSDVGFFAP